MKHQGYLELQHRLQQEQTVQNELVSLRSQVINLQNIVAQKDSQINSLNNIVTSGNNQISQLSNELQQIKQQGHNSSNTQDSLLNEKDAVINSLKLSLKAKEEQLQDNKLLLTQKDQIVNILGSNITDLKKDKAELKAKLQDLDSSNFVPDDLFQENVLEISNLVDTSALEQSVNTELNGDNTTFEEL